MGNVGESAAGKRDVVVCNSVRRLRQHGYVRTI
jgi:hypothetical protein